MNFFETKIYPVIHKCVSGLRERLRVRWYKVFKDKLFPFESIVDEHNAHLYCAPSMSALMDDCDEQVFLMKFTFKIKEIRYIPDNVIMINIFSCGNLERITCEYPSGLRRLDIEYCGELREVPVVPDSLIFWWQLSNTYLDAVYYYNKESILNYKLKKELKKFLI